MCKWGRERERDRERERLINNVEVCQMRSIPVKSVFMEIFGASPTVRVLDYLLSVYPLDCSISDIAENAQISRTTLHYAVMPDLIKNDALKMTRALLHSAKLS